MRGSPVNILKKKTSFAWNSHPQQPRGIVQNKGVFKFILLFEVFIFQRIFQYPSSKSTWGEPKRCNIWNLLTMKNLKRDKSFQNFIELSRLNLQVFYWQIRLSFSILHLSLTKPSRLGMIWSLVLPCRITLYNFFVPKNLFPHEKLLLISGNPSVL